VTAIAYEGLALIGAAMVANLAWVKIKARQAQAETSNDTPKEHR
jgi:hypothetical protein